MPVGFGCYGRRLTSREQRAIADEIRAKASDAKRRRDAKTRAKWERIKNDFANARRR